MKHTNKPLMYFRNLIIFIQSITVLICSCASTKTTTPVIISSNSLSENLGKTITITGKAINMKLGAGILTQDTVIIFMDDMKSWPTNYYFGEYNSVTVKVTGKLIERNDLPVFSVKKNDSVLVQGIYVPDGVDINKAKHRFLIKNAKFVTLN